MVKISKKNFNISMLIFDFYILHFYSTNVRNKNWKNTSSAPRKAATPNEIPMTIAVEMNVSRLVGQFTFTISRFDSLMYAINLESINKQHKNLYHF